MAVLVDSSVWISAAKVANEECLQLRRMIQKREHIVITDLIQLEVCQGAKTEVQFKQLWESLLGFSVLETKQEYIYRSALNYIQLRKSGLTSSTVDCLIATVAQLVQLPLWTNDNTLIKVAKFLKVSLHKA